MIAPVSPRPLLREISEFLILFSSKGVLEAPSSSGNVTPASGADGNMRSCVMIARDNPPLPNGDPHLHSHWQGMSEFTFQHPRYRRNVNGHAANSRICRDGTEFVFHFANLKKKKKVECNEHGEGKQQLGLDTLGTARWFVVH